MTSKRTGGTLHNWHISGGRVMGIIYKDDQWVDGTPLRTSTAISISEDRKTLETLNTIYTLGEQNSSMSKVAKLDDSRQRPPDA